MVITPTQSVVSKGSLWMKCPALNQDDVIPGLAFIYPLEQLIVAKKRDNRHDIISKSGDAYTIFNSGGEKVFVAVSEKRFRQFYVKIFNNYGNEVINVERPFTLCENKVLVWSPPGNFLGSISERINCFGTYIFRDENDKKVLEIRADGLFQYGYKVYLVSCDERSIGELRDRYPVIDVDNFGVTFPKEMDVKNKVVLLGACFLIGGSKC